MKVVILAGGVGSRLSEETTILTPCKENASEIDDQVWKKAVAILAWHEIKYTKELINKLENCKVIVRVGVGFDNVNLEAAGKKGIIVCNIPDYGTSDVADHTLSLILTLTREIYSFNEKIRLNNIWSWEDCDELRRINKLTLGIIGLGRIGTAVAMRAKSFGLKVVFYDPYIRDGYEKSINVNRIRKLPELLEQSDIVSIHTPLTEETREMANEEFFESIKDNSILINTARGKIIGLDALYKAIKSSKIKAAGLDVLPQEPPNPNHPLIKAWRKQEPWIFGRLIITPHAAFYNQESYKEMRLKAAQEAKRVLKGKKPRNCVNLNYLKY